MGLPGTKRLGYICSCGTPIRLSGRGLESMEQLKEWREKKRKENWEVMVNHAEGAGGCGRSKLLHADDVILLELAEE